MDVFAAFKRWDGDGRPAFRVGALTITLLGSLVVTATSSIPASADPGNTADPTWQTTGGVHGIARTPSRIFLGGAFSQVRPPSGSGGGSVARTRLAALDASTGAVVPGWHPSANGIVRAMAVSPDGSRVYAGGEFSSVDGQSRSHIVALDSVTGALIQTWNPSTSGRVYSIVTLGNTVYVAGSFSSVNGSSRQRVAALDASTGQLINGWNPGANDTVRSLALSPDGTRVYLGGKFSSVGGSSRSSLAAVDSGSGSLLSWKPSVPAEVMSVAASRSRVVVGTAGAGGNCVGYDPQTASQRWLVHADGNVQAVGIAGRLAYCGGHGALAGSETRKKIFAVDATSGAMAAWNPGMNSSVGVRVILVYGSQISIGGDFTQVNTEYREGFAQFTDPDIAPPGVALPFADSFDAGLWRWGEATNVTVDPLAFDSASPSARFEVASGQAFLSTLLTTPETTVCLRSSVSVVDRDGGELELLRLLAANGTPVAGASVSPGGELLARSEVSGDTIATGAQLPFGWSTVQLCATVGGSGSLAVFLDGSLAGQIGTNNGTPKIGRIQLGDRAGNRSFTMFFDDVAAGVNPT